MEPKCAEQEGKPYTVLFTTNLRKRKVHVGLFRDELGSSATSKQRTRHLSLQLAR
ncbi:hypothetical protein Syun_024398 [Stephania yunnanensis]|uniref:Uncharacterized protein n=1 Tax=Stephania yunnanensis TaxID=152371 RepID=A0AAP0I4A4_9MAGN